MILFWIYYCIHKYLILLVIIINKDIDITIQDLLADVVTGLYNARFPYMFPHL